MEEVESEGVEEDYELSDLLPGSYTYCLVAWNQYGETLGQGVTFTTGGECSPLWVHTGEEPGALPMTGLQSLSPPAKGRTLLGTIHLQCGGKVSYHFAYGTATTSGSSTPTEEVNVSSHTEPQVLAHLTGLQANTTYHYVLVATYGTDTVSGSEVEFTTPPVGEAPEAPITEGCGGPIIAGHGERFCGTLNPGTNAKTGYYFAYNKGNTCTGGGRTSTMPEVEGERMRMTAEVFGLEPGIGYSYCLVATNVSGETVGSSLTFIAKGGGRPASNTPQIDSESASEISEYDATLEAQIDPGGLETTYKVQIGTPPNYELEIGCPPPGACLWRTTVTSVMQGALPPGSVDRGVRVDLNDAHAWLHPNTTYHYRMVAINSDGTTEGIDKTFTTAPAAPPGLPEGSGGGAQVKVEAERQVAAQRETEQARPFTPLIATSPANTTTTKALTAATLTRGQKLARAMKLCDRKPKRQRARCQRRAHKTYGASGKQASRKRHKD